MAGVYPSRATLPAVGGGEGVGHIYSVGSAVKTLSLGDLVIRSPYIPGKYSSLEYENNSDSYPFNRLYESRFKTF